MMSQKTSQALPKVERARELQDVINLEMLIIVGEFVLVFKCKCTSI